MMIKHLMFHTAVGLLFTSAATMVIGNDEYRIADFYPFWGAGGYTVHRYRDLDSPDWQFTRRDALGSVGQIVIDGDWVLVVERLNFDSDYVEGEEPQGSSYFALSEEFWHLVGMREIEDEPPGLTVFDPPLAIFPTVMPVGETHQDSAVATDPLGSTMTVSAESTLIGPTTSSVTAGDFDDCLDLELLFGQWLNELTPCRGVGEAAGRVTALSDEDAGDVYELVEYGREPFPDCSSGAFDIYEARILGAYLSYYGRAADAAGLAYWADRLAQEGGDLTSVIEAFGRSEEFDRRFGGLDNQALVTNIYRQVLGREPDPAGLAFYVGELDAGRMTLQSIALNVLDGVQGEDVALVDNRLATSGHFVTRQAELGEAGFAVHDSIIAQVLDNVGADPYEARAACTAFDSLLSGESPFRYEP